MVASSRISDIAFTPTVKAVQEEKGSRQGYERMAEHGDWPDHITPEVATWLATRDSVYLATANADGQPYIQHRGGPPGFIHVLDDRTIAFADFAGNRQYISVGNLRDNPRAFLFAMDYCHPRRLKFWGRAEVIEDDPDLLARVTPIGYPAQPERVVVFHIEAWDENCRKHISPR